MSDSSGGLTELLGLSGKVALVTGAGRGVGAETAKFLAAAGAVVVVNDFYAGRAAAVADEICSRGGAAVAETADVGDYGAVSAMVARIGREVGPVQILVNNAGNAGPTPGQLRPFWQTVPADWAPYLAVNLYGVLACCRAVVPGMMEAGYGRLVTVVSDAGRVGEAGLEAYSAAKAGSAGLMRSLAQSLGRFGITANSVALGITRTAAVEQVLESDDHLTRLLARYPIRRVGEPADAASLISFLASPAASWITGQTYPVNGGFSVTQ